MGLTLDETPGKAINTGVLKGTDARAKRREKSSLQKIWRRERDSNPRYGFRPYTRFPVVLLQPLGHLSILKLIF